MTAATSNSTRKQVQDVLVITLLLNLAVAFSKIVIGLLSGVLTVTADGFHSLVDGSSNIVALVANHIAQRPPDADHPYGHRRFETIASLAIGLFLLVTAWEITGSALARLRGGGEQPDVTPLTFGVMLATLAVNLFVTGYESRAGRRLRSELLIADAAHTRTDVYVSLSVLVSLVFMVTLGWTWVDTVAALGIVVLIVRAAWQILSQTGGVLVDKAPYDSSQLARWAEELPCVERVIRARSRGPADAAHVDIDVQVARETTTDRANAIAGAIRERLNQELDGIAEVEVHFVPQATDTTDYALLARAQADALGLATHEVHLSDGAVGKVLEMHVEVPGGQSLQQAHERVSQLELHVREKLPDIAEVVTHIEPTLTPPERTLSADQAECIQAGALTILEARCPAGNWHHLHVYPLNGGFALTLHVALPAELSLDQAHHISEDAEIALRAAIPQLERVTIHTEPTEMAAS